MVLSSNFGGGEICSAIYTGLEAIQPSVQWISVLSPVSKGRITILTTHLFLAPSCELIGAVSLHLVCVCIGMSWSDFTSAFGAT